MSKRSAIVGLLGINLFLLAVLIVASYDVPAAQAQTRGRPGDFVMATVQIHNDYDALVVVDIPTAALYVFVPRRVSGGAKLAFTDGRDLNRDFQRGTR